MRLAVILGLFFSTVWAFGEEGEFYELVSQKNSGVEDDLLIKGKRALPRHNMTVSDKDKFVWIRVAKVGTRSVYRALDNNRVERSLDVYQFPFDAEKYRDYFKFAFVRNPWARVVSCYVDKVLTKNYPNFRECFNKPFEYFVEFISRQNLAKSDAHIKLQTKLIPMEDVDFIGRIENFDVDLPYVLAQIGLEDLTVPHAHSTKHVHYSKYYTDRTKRIIEKKYKADIEAFGYFFESE